MTLKEELETLRGEPIKVFDGNPLDIPYIETSDKQKLCRHPVVSVNMITYNHEPYIRQAIEGVVMQKTDFEYELVIGEDCSQDKTREICFEYQKKYPEKIRVLWWHENVSKFGGNGRRNQAHCRGEFVAFCEGDDWWIDPFKLQKQVNLLRRHTTAGVCFGAVRFYYEAKGTSRNPTSKELKSGFEQGNHFLSRMLLEQNPKGRNILQTSGNMFRMSTLRVAYAKYDVFSWNLLVGDVTGWMACSSLSDVCYLPDVVSTYRINQGGITRRRLAEVLRDGDSIAYYFIRTALGFSLKESLRWTHKRFVRMWVNKAAMLNGKAQRDVARQIECNENLRKIFHSPYSIIMLFIIRVGILTPKIAFWLNRIFWYMPRLGFRVPIK